MHQKGLKMVDIFTLCETLAFLWIGSPFRGMVEDYGFITLLIVVLYYLADPYVEVPKKLTST